MEELLIFSLLFTILIELITSIILGIDKKIDLLYIVIINILTNPFAEYINLLFKDNKFHYPIIFLIEIFITIIEFLFLKKVLKSKNINFLHLSIINNLCSYIVSFILI